MRTAPPLVRDVDRNGLRSPALATASRSWRAGLVDLIRRRLEALLWLAAIAMAAGQLWNRRFEVHSDGLSYLELADAWLAGDWRHAANAIWSPLYAWLTAGVLGIFAPAPASEAPVVKLLNLGILIAVLAAFRSLMGAAYSAHRTLAARRGGHPLPRAVFLTTGYALVTWASLRLAPVARVSPDLLLTLFVYALAAQLLRGYGHPGTRGRDVRFGMTLGVGYLAKTTLLAVAPIHLAAATWLARGRVARRRRLLAAAGGLVLVAAPFAMLLSIAEGRVTAGQAGAWNAARFVGGIGIPVHWQGEPPGSGIPRHPTRRLLADPALFEFAGPVPGVYPPWRDPAYWYDGARVRHEWQGHLRVLGLGTRRLAGILAQPLYVVLLLLLCVAAFGTRIHYGATLRRLWFLWLPPLAAIAAYLLVYLEARYIAGHLTVIGVAALSALTWPASPRRRRTLQVLALASWLPLLPAAATAARGAAGVAVRVAQGRPFSKNPSWEAARQLEARGILPGSRVAYIGSGFRFYWARLAGVRVVAEIRQFDPDGETTRWAMSPEEARGRDAFRPHVVAFWTAPPDVQRRVMQQFTRAGAVAVVSDWPASLTAPGWERLGTTGLAVYPLSHPRTYTGVRHPY